jgi:hypothetical protein
VGVIEKGGRNPEWTKNVGYLFSFSLFKIDRKVDREFIFSFSKPLALWKLKL